MLIHGKLADQIGCHVETVRYYEKVGLLPDPAATPGGSRVYNDEHIKILDFIQRAKTLELSSERIRELLGLSDRRKEHTRADVKFITVAHTL